jgi:hypothetical protein
MNEERPTKVEIVENLRKIESRTHTCWGATRFAPTGGRTSSHRGARGPGHPEREYAEGGGGREAGWLPRVNEEDRFYARATVTESGSAS